MNIKATFLNFADTLQHELAERQSLTCAKVDCEATDVINASVASTSLQTG